MKTICFLRHAKSSWSNPALTDYDRPLNARGRKAATRMGEYLATLSPPIDLVYASSAARARETIDRASTALLPSTDIRYREDLYMTSTGTILDIIRSTPDAASTVLLVGHNPSFENAILRIASENRSALRNRVAAKFPTCAFAQIALPIDTWPEAAFGQGDLRHVLYVADLDR